MSEATGTLLDEILARRLERVHEAQRLRSRVSLERAAAARTDFRSFEGAIAGGGLRVIAEMKRASPSAGVLRSEYDCGGIARAYEAAGAAALSVLTAEDYFAGSLDDLGEARAAVRLPVLRKDFIVDEYQVYESVAGGADALLLIVAALEDSALRHLIQRTGSLGLAALVEVHTEEELDYALDAGARIVGVNNRNLKTLDVDLETSLRLRARIPSNCLAVSESGIRSGADLRRLAAAGYHAALIGEHFMRADDPGDALARLLAEGSQ